MISDKALFDILKPTEDIDAHKEERVKLVIEHVEFEQKTNDYNAPKNQDNSTNNLISSPPVRSFKV